MQSVNRPTVLQAGALSSGSTGDQSTILIHIHQTPIGLHIVRSDRDVAHAIELIRSNGDLNALPWWERVVGAFKDDQVYAAAMKLGAEIRQADQPEEAGE